MSSVAATVPKIKEIASPPKTGSVSIKLVPKTVEIAVNKIERSRTAPASQIASRNSMPSSIKSCTKSIINKEFLTTTPAKAINPIIEKGQIEGGFVQGAGWLTMEEVKWKSNGQLTTHSPSTYKIPAVNDMPEKFNVKIFKNLNRENVVNKSKTTGEPPLMLAMSVFFAIKDAISSVGNYKIIPQLNAPATPEAILMSIKNLKSRL